jgi:hypothetical protein
VNAEDEQRERSEGGASQEGDDAENDDDGK